MNGTERVGSIITICLLAAFTAMLLVVSSCTLQKAKLDAPNNMMVTKSRHLLQSQCTQMRGNWDGQYMTCNFEKSN